MTDDGRGSAPLSELQEALRLSYEFDPTSAAFHGATSVRIREDIDPEAMRRAWQAFSERHAILRTTFHTSTARKAFQRVNEAYEAEFSYADARGCTETALGARVVEGFRQPFDLTRSALRAQLYRVGARDNVFVVTTHHIAFDLMSADVMHVELPVLYAKELGEAAADLPPVSVSYLDYVTQEPALAAQAADAEEYWRRQLAGAPLGLPMRADHPRDGAPRIAATHSFVLPRDLIASLAKISPNTFRVLLASYQAFLHRYGARADIVVGTPAGVRTEAFKDTVGDFVNMLLLRTTMREEASFLEFLDDSGRVLSEAAKRRHYPFLRVAERLPAGRDAAGRARSIPTSFTINKTVRIPEMGAFMIRDAPWRARFGPMPIEPFALAQQEGQYDFALWGAEVDGAFHMELKYNTSLFERGTVARLAQSFTALVESIARDPSVAVGDLALATEAERRRVLVEWGGVRKAFAQKDALLHELVEAQARRTPDAIALESDETRMTYRELDAAAEGVAAQLIAFDVSPGKLVGVLMDRSVAQVVGMLGTLKAGAAYVPIDTSYPEERVLYMLADAACPVVLTQAQHRARLAGTSARVVVVEERAAPGGAAVPTARRARPEDPAYVIYTSGSTGQPKGVVVPHRAIVNHMLWMADAFDLSASDVVLQKTPSSFDASVWEFYAPLVVGGRLVVAPPDAHRDTRLLVEACAKHAVTILQLVPSLAQHLVDEPRLSDLRALRILFCGGEALRPDIVERFFSRHPARVVNLYGPTEACIDATSYECARGAAPPDPIPIGRPIANATAYVLDRRLRPVPVGGVGELFLGGVGLALGYKGRDALTAERFVVHPETGERLYATGDRAAWRSDGNLAFFGRADDQVKLRGHRIELGEVSAALAAHPAVREAAVVVHAVGGASRLVGYATLRDGASAAPTDLTAFVRARLPEPMVPSAVVLLEAFPRSPSGKLDRAALPPPAEDTAAADRYVAPRTDVERTLARIWGELLKLDRVGIHDNFFELGGDSLIAIQVVARARAAGMGVTVSTFLRKPTIAELAELPMSKPRGPAPPPREPRGDEDVYPLTRLQHYMLQKSVTHAAYGAYHCASTYRVGVPFEREPFERAVRDLVARHPVLRTSFDLSGAEPLQRVHARVEVPITIEDARGAPPLRFDDLIRAESLKPYVWSAAPLLYMRVHLLDEHAFQLTFRDHHAILDGWSVAVMMKELMARYRAARAGATFDEPPPSASFKDFVALERAADDAEAREFSKRELADAPTLRLDAPTAGDAASPPPRLVVDVDEALSPRLREVARAASVPLKSMVLAAHVWAIGALTGSRDVLTAGLANGRPEALDAERALGMFWNPVPHRQRIDDAASFMDLARAAFEIERQWTPHRRFPWARLDEGARGFGGDPYSEFVFNFIHFHILEGTTEFTDWQIEDFQNHTLSVVCKVEANRARTMRLYLQGDPRKVGRRTLERMGRLLTEALHKLATAPSEAASPSR